MLKVFRDNLKNLAPVLWVVIAVFVLLMFAYPDNNPPAASNVAATVNGREISFSDYQTAYNNLENRFREIYGENYSSDLARQIGLPQQALNSLVAQQILISEAEDLGLQATDEEVREAILQIPAFQNERGQFDQQRYEQLLRSNRFSVDSFEAETREQLLLQKFNQILADSVWISEAEARRQVREETDSAVIRYARLRGSAITEDQSISEGELQAFFDENRDDYRVPEQRRVAYLTVNNAVVRSSIEISDEELQAYYDANPDEFTREEQVRARHILLFVNDDRTAEEAQAQLQDLKARAEAGEPFQDLARQFSEDEATKERGGDLGFFGRNRMTPQFEDAAFAGEVGTIVGPVENQLGPRTGYHLIQIQNRREGGLQDFDQVKNRIRVRQINERAGTAAEDKANEIKASLAERVFASPEELEEFANGDDLIGYQITDSTDRDTPIPGVGRNNAFVEAAFAAPAGVLSDPIRIAPGWALVTAFEIQPPRLPELDEVEDRVRADLQTEKKRDAARARVAEALASRSEGATIDDLAADLGADIEDSSLIRLTGAVGGLTDDPEFNQQVLALDEGDFGGPFEVDDGAVIYQVTTRNRFDEEAFELEKDDTLERLRQQRVGSLVQSLIERRRGEIKLNISPQLRENFELPANPENS